MGEKLPHLAVELRGKRLVVRHDQRRPLLRLDDIRHREGLARSGHPKQSLPRKTGLQPVDQAGDCLGLVPRGLKIGLEPKVVSRCFVAGHNWLKIPRQRKN